MTNRPRIPEPPIDPDDTQPCETASPYARVPPDPLYDLEQFCFKGLAILGQFAANGIHLPLEREVELTYQQVVAERMRRDHLIDPDVRLLSFNDKDES